MQIRKYRTINFKGVYTSTINKETGDIIEFVNNEPPSTVYAPYKIPAGCTCYIRGASAYFE